MNEHTQVRDAFASPFSRIDEPVIESGEESGARSTLPPGRHRLPRGKGTRAASFGPFRTIAVVVSTAALAAAAFAVGTHHDPAPSPARAQAAVSVPQLTTADVQQLEHMTPAEAARLAADLNTAYGKLGVHVGVAPSGTPALPDGATQSAADGKPILTSYQWAAGVQWDHVWVIASYANLESIANNSSVIVSTAAAACGKAKSSDYAVACFAIGNLIAYFLSKVHVTNWSPSHGIWAAWYWIPWGLETGGFW
jgi:hypothetical protein